MNLENINSWILPFASSIAIILAGVAVFFTKFRELKDKSSRELIDTLKETAQAEREKAERLREENEKQRTYFQKEINDLKIEMANLKTLYETSEKSKQEYLEILKDKNPEQIAFMKLLTEAANQSKETITTSSAYMSESLKVLADIHKFMKTLNDKAIENENRNKRVDAQKSKPLEIKLRGEAK